MIEDGSYFSGKEDPLTRLLGPEHGGRSRTTSHIIAPSKVHGGLFQGGGQLSQKKLPTARSFRGVDSSPSIRGASDTSGGSHIHYPVIEECTSCELLFPYSSGEEKIVGTGLVYPTVDRALNEEKMDEG
ncbi:uncharacterized protein LOC143571061 [Bidens hawaiensis]|uniref:uncharacterized protein LOC143571061 n=1 Tax=Bidens hawaiensis TaxID=980011 RepID=UPI00404B9C83